MAGVSAEWCRVDDEAQHQVDERRSVACARSFASSRLEAKHLLERSRGSRQVIIEPGQRHDDSIPLRIAGSRLVNPTWCELVFIDGSFLHGAVFDTVRWSGWLQPMQLVNGVIRRNHQIPLIAAPAQIARDIWRSTGPRRCIRSGSRSGSEGRLPLLEGQLQCSRRICAVAGSPTSAVSSAGAQATVVRASAFPRSAVLRAAIALAA